MPPSPSPRILCIGEIVWDCFDKEKRLGGSPLNFAYICSQMGAKPTLISSVGTDSDGAEAIREIESHGLSSAHVQRHQVLPTSKAQIAHDTQGSPIFSLDPENAWDDLRLFPEDELLTQNADAIFFGSLCQRSNASKTTIRQLITKAPPQTLKLFDVNIRKPHFSSETLLSSLEMANALKLSDEELGELSEILNLKGEVRDQLKQIRGNYGLKLIILTCGRQGSLILHENEIVRMPAENIDVVDTTGAGDSFAATFCTYLLRGPPSSTRQNKQLVSQPLSARRLEQQCSFPSIFFHPSPKPYEQSQALPLVRNLRPRRLPFRL
ncbi:PfkB family carbohydrate kinase [Pelagicoccus mobilis]|uniref:Carbohydrate kinase PfkB domain-containing protein n=1 Tax=Pelagicoccus mobilis TaxID=415221 RepID=A0A934RT73_9BACT|nr:PfkB family carbohydrate kinase [Pelagicoccus mobilis]MBK1875936.1 hypothetical protein [Pelagicoccus mobilis]